MTTGNREREKEGESRLSKLLSQSWDLPDIICWVKDVVSKETEL